MCIEAAFGLVLVTFDAEEGACQHLIVLFDEVVSLGIISPEVRHHDLIVDGNALLKRLKAKGLHDQDVTSRLDT